MKRTPTVADLSGGEEIPKKKSFLEQVSDKLPRFKIPKKSCKSPLKCNISEKTAAIVPISDNEPSQETDKTISPSTDQNILSQSSDQNISSQSSDQYISSQSSDQCISSSLPQPISTDHNQIISEPKSQSDTTPSETNPVDNAELARQHYNQLKQVSMDKRHESRIFNLRGFNNYVKSLTMNDFLARLGPLGKRGAKILDLGCGKGGDLRKWGLAKPAHVVCVDIADVSVEQCRSRYRERPNELTFKANFIVADCTRVDLDEKYVEENIPDIEFDLVSCQFALHYGFESQAQAKRMIKNAVSHLKPGCFFTGTIPNSNYLVKKYLSLSEGSRFGNDVYYVDFQEENRTSFPLFGAKYVFYLHGAVEELPEFLIHFPLLKSMLEDEGCECVLAEPFTDFVYKTDPNTGERVMKEVEVVSRTRGLNDQGTLPRSEWEVVACYMAFGFRKLTEAEQEERRDKKRRKLE